jgi:hypothetical protein
MKTKIILISLAIITIIIGAQIKEPNYHFYSSSTEGIIQKELKLKGTWTNSQRDRTVEFEFTYSKETIDVLILPINSYECEVYIDEQFYRFLDYEINPKNFTRLEGQEMFVTYTTGHKVFWVFLIHNNDGVYSLTPWKSTSPI